MTFTFTKPETIAGTPVQDAEDPTVIRSGDHVYVVWHEFPTNFDPLDPQPDVFLARSTDRGVTFAPRTNLSSSRTVFSGEEHVAVAGTKVYVVWNEGGDVFLTRDTNDNGSFDTPKKLNTTPQASVPRVAAADDNVYVTWQAPGPNGAADVFFTRSTDKGATFDAEVDVSMNDGESLAPSIALLSDTRVIIAWRDDSGGNGFEILFARGK